MVGSVKSTRSTFWAVVLADTGDEELGGPELAVRSADDGVEWTVSGKGDPDASDVC